MRSSSAGVGVAPPERPGERQREPFQTPATSRYDALSLHGAAMKRRQFLGLVGGAAVVGPRGALGQQSAMPVVGFLSARSPKDSATAIAAFQKGLAAFGYAEGRNVTTEYRWAEGQYDRLPGLAVDLVRRQVAAIAAFSPPAAQAAI